MFVKGPLTDLFESLLRKIYSHLTSSFLVSWIRVIYFSFFMTSKHQWWCHQAMTFVMWLIYFYYNSGIIFERSDFEGISNYWQFHNFWKKYDFQIGMLSVRVNKVVVVVAMFPTLASIKTLRKRLDLMKTMFPLAL